MIQIISNKNLQLRKKKTSSFYLEILLEKKTTLLSMLYEIPTVI